MSDRFLSVRARVSLSHALKGREEANVDIYPLAPVQEGVESFNSTNVGKRCGNYGLKLLEPLVLPSVVDNVDGETIQSSYFWGGSTIYNLSGGYENGRLILNRVDRSNGEVEGERFLVPDTLYLPIGPPRLPKYVPSEQFYTYSVDVYKQAFHNYLLGQGLGTEKVKEGGTRAIKEVPPTNTEGDVNEFAELYSVCERSFVGLAPWPTQLKRLSQLYKVNRGDDGFNKVKSFREQGRTMQEVLDILQVTLPLSKPDTDIVSLLNKPSDYVQAFMAEDGTIELIDGTPKIRDQSMAGLPFEQHKKKESCKWSALLIADLIYAEINDSVSQYVNDDLPSSFMYSDAIKKVLEKFPFLLENYMIPKSERYDVGDNTRNIVAVSSVTHYLAGKITMPLGAGPSINAGNSQGCMSLHGFSAVNGNLDRLVKSMIHEAEDRVDYWIYADNIYILWHGDWYSCDLTKGESQATRDVAAAVGWHFLRNLYQEVTDEGEFILRHNRTWAVIATILLPAILVDSSVVYSNKRIFWPGQLSGNAWTFYMNHVVSSMIVSALREADNPKPNSDGWKEVMKKGGWNIKIELHEKKFAQRCRDLLNSELVPSDQCMNVEPDRIRMDLLGWSACFVNHKGTNCVVPVLDDHRLRKNLMLPKKRSQINTSETTKLLAPLYDAAHSNSQFQATMLVGAWSKPIWWSTSTQMLASTSGKYFKSLAGFEVGPKVNFKEFTGELPLDFEGMNVIKQIRSSMSMDFIMGILLGSGDVPTEPEQNYNVTASADTLRTTTAFVYKSNKTRVGFSKSVVTETTRWGDVVDDENFSYMMKGDMTPIFKSVSDMIKLIKTPLITTQPFDEPMSRKGPDVYKNYKVVYNEGGIIDTGGLVKTRANVVVDSFMEKAMISGKQNYASKRVKQRRKARIEDKAMQRASRTQNDNRIRPTKFNKRKMYESEDDEDQRQQTESDYYEYIEAPDHPQDDYVW